MTRDDIYDHLAKVYIGKKSQTKDQKKRQFNAWLVINIVITVFIFASSFYGLSAFLAHRGNVLQDRIIYALSNGPIRISYNFGYPYPPVKRFVLTVPEVNANRYKKLQFSIRGLDKEYPGVVRVELRNRKNEVSSVMIEGVFSSWKTLDLSLEQFSGISDWSQVSEVSFVLESWNTVMKQGVILIDDLCFAS